MQNGGSILDKFRDKSIQHARMGETSLFMKGKQRESNSIQNEQSKTKYLTELIQTQQTFDRHHYGTNKANKSKLDSQID